MLTFAEVINDLGRWLGHELWEGVRRLYEFPTFTRCESNVDGRVFGLDKPAYTNVFDFEVGLGLANPDLEEALLILSHVHNGLLFLMRRLDLFLYSDRFNSWVNSLFLKSFLCMWIQNKTMFNFFFSSYLDFSSLFFPRWLNSSGCSWCAKKINLCSRLNIKK